MSLVFILDGEKDSMKCLIKENQIVNHKIFGKGKVERIEGSGPNSKITVLFFNVEPAGGFEPPNRGFAVPQRMKP